MKVITLSQEDKEVALRKQVEDNANQIWILKRKIELCMDRIEMLERKYGVQENRVG